MAWRRKGDGFTLTELVITLVIVAALSVFVLPRLNIAGFDSYSLRQEVVNSLRYAQKIAGASRCPVRVELSTDEVRVVVGKNDDDDCGNEGDSFSHPARGGDYIIEPERSARLQGDLADVTFDSRGEFTPGDGSDQTITFSGGGSVTVVAGTGYVDA